MTPTRPHDKPPIPRAALSDALAEDAQEMEDKEQKDILAEREFWLSFRNGLLMQAAAIEQKYGLRPSKNRQTAKK